MTLSAWHTVLFVFQQLCRTGNSKYPYFTEKETEAQRTVQDPRSSEYQGLDSNQGLPACSQSLALSLYYMISQALCQGLFRNERLPITVSKALHGICLLCCQILPWLRDALENLDLNASNIQRILFPTNEETIKFNGYGEHLPPMERGERGAGSSHSLVLSFPFPHYFAYYHQCNWSASAWLVCEL